MTFKVICRKSTVYRNSTSPLYLLFFQGKRKKYIRLGVSVAPAHWDAEAQKVTDDCPDRDNIQFKITAKIKEYEKRIQRLEIMELPVTLENLFGQNGKRVNCTVGDYLKQIIERLEALGKYASASKHRVLCSHLSRFRSLNIRFDEIDLTFLRDFELFLRKNGNASNSIATKFAIFKAAYNKALADGIFIQKVNPFAKYKVGSLWTRTRKRAITKGDIRIGNRWGTPTSRPRKSTSIHLDIVDFSIINQSAKYSWFALFEKFNLFRFRLKFIAQYRLKNFSNNNETDKDFEIISTSGNSTLLMSRSGSFCNV